MATQSEAPSKTQRDRIRATILGNKKGESKVIEFLGEEIEVRQPSIGVAMDFSKLEDSKDSILKILTDHCFVPGTSETIFEATDAVELLQLPFGDDMQRLMETFQQLVGSDEDNEAKNSEKTQQLTT